MWNPFTLNIYIYTIFVCTYIIRFYVVYCASLQVTGCDVGPEGPTVPWTQPGQPGPRCHSVTKGGRHEGCCKKMIWTTIILFLFLPTHKEWFIVLALYTIYLPSTKTRNNMRGCSQMRENQGSNLCLIACQLKLISQNIRTTFEVQQQCFNSGVNCFSVHQKHQAVLN